MAPRAFITGLSGTAITADERALLRATTPWGLILFKRNVETPAQVKALIDEFREIVGRPEAPVLVDQEGGRVQRLGPPQWPAYPPGAAYGRLYDRDPAVGVAAAKLGGRLIAADLARLGITVDCLPVADVPVLGSDAVIGDRAYGNIAYQGRGALGQGGRRRPDGGWRAAGAEAPAGPRPQATAGQPSAAAGGRNRAGDLEST